jgi:DNA-binding winged helix-turn-helix (wHTH) protein
MQKPTSRRYRFEPFEVDFGTDELRRRGLRLKVSGQPLHILEMLLEHPGEVVSREELRRVLWEDDTFVDFERGLNAAMNRWREALGDSATKPRYIETLPRLGYRFIAPVSGPSAASSGQAEFPVGPSGTAVDTAPATIRMRTAILCLRVEPRSPERECRGGEFRD